MTTQPEALKLAGNLEALHGHKLSAKAAAEMRRLHESNQELLAALQSINECCDEDHASRDYASRQTEIRGIARAAINKAERTTT